MLFRSNTTEALKSDIDNIVVIYAENRSFDSLFGHFPGANGLSAVMDSSGKPTSGYIAQVDRDGSALSTLPPVWGGVTAGGITPAVTQAQSAGLANQPFSVETAFQTSANATLDLTTVTRDMYHRFFENQMQINGGKNDKFVAWADSGAMVMGQFDSSSSALYKLAQQYTLADNFFQGAFGGSFLNHQYLICACAPEYPNADTAAAAPTIAVLDTDSSGAYTHNLSVASSSPSSAMDGKPVFVKSGNIAPANYFGDNKFYAVNTMQPPYQPSGNAPVDTSGNNALYANTTKSTTLPAQTATHIGDLLSAKGVSWKWYAGSWNAATNDGTQDPATTRSVIYAGNSYGVATTANVDFQPHHQPFNYYAAFDPATHAAARAQHLKDFDADFLADADAGRLPTVSFYKPQGNLNQHAGYANVADGDAHIAELVARLQKSPQWPHMLIVVTYDENGGFYDHARVPRGDRWGPGTRIPAIIVSPLARRSFVDKTPYDTASILRFITRRWNLEPLPGVLERDRALQANGFAPMGDLSAALQAP